ncbi:MAG: tripartite tricarboxylate transporter substrate-binding protein, partial [Rhodoplanes sp.]
DTVRALAIFDTKRSPALPDLPTALEQGTPDLVAYTWNAIFLPKNAPQPIVDKLNAVAREAMKSPQVRERLESLGAQVVSEDRMTPEYLRKFVEAEIAKWAAPIKASGVVIE